MIAEQKAAGRFDPAAHPLSRPPEVEAEAISRYLRIAALAEAPVNIVHLSTALGLAEVRAARQQGQEVYVETCPQYLLLDDSKYSLPDFGGAKYVLSPPLRKAIDQQALWRAFNQGEIDTLGTDHCSFLLEQKAVGLYDFSKIPNGIPGVQHRPSLIYTYGVGQGKITMEQMVAALSTNVAKLFGMYPQKGVLQLGSDGDVVIWDPKIQSTITAAEQAHRVDNTPFEGFALQGGPREVFLRGELVVSEGRLQRPLQGRYIQRQASVGWRSHKGARE
jgi:dihydropyrimidinase